MEQLVGMRQNACFERVRVLDSSPYMDEIVGIFVSLTVVPEAQGIGCWSRVLLGSCWVGESDSQSQKRIAGRY